MQFNTLTHTRMIPADNPSDGYWELMSPLTLINAEATSQKSLSEMTSQEIAEQMTIWQHLVDRALNILEQRGNLPIVDGMPIVPYVCEYYVPTILTRHNM